MNTFQIAESALKNYKKDRLSDERVNFLLAQVKEQLDELSQKKEIYRSFLEEIDAPDQLDDVILWILLMSNEDIARDYINQFDKNLTKVIPVSDLADLLLYTAYLKKVKKTKPNGYDFLSTYYEEEMEEVDQYSVTNVLQHIQQSKEVQIAF
jgi:hypothetical protein